ncbi:MAG: type II toxin-antitoxin system RelE/ParE family toxin, partial [Oligoflexia bacterium]|nr:type II toxin-antitoxin system RelE/ParE family toxin [Oligoflexia bacterium]
GKILKQVDNALERIKQNPEHGKPLRGELRGIWSERVATFRILYRINKKEIEIIILTIEHRKRVYGGH